MSKLNVRYIVNDVKAATVFDTEHLDFEVDMHPAPGFAALSRGNLQLYLNQPGVGGAGQAMPEGQGGKQVLLEDPSGNLIELFEPYER